MGKSPEISTTPEVVPAKNIAIVFPGQGSQFVGMGRELFDQSDAARHIFQRVDNFLDFPLSTICFYGPSERLAQTHIAQLAIGTTCIAAYEALKERYPDLRPVVGGGVSFGELPNLVAAGVINLYTLLNLIQRRGEVMEEAASKNPGRMVAVIGVEDRELIDKVCTETGVFPGIWYPGLTVISGENGAIERAIQSFRQRRIPTKETGVLYPFHTPLMARAEEKLRQVLSNIQFENPSYPIVINATGEATRSGEAIKQALPQQLTNAVDVPQTLDVMRQMGSAIFIEFCPKPIVGSYITRLYRPQTAEGEIQVISVHDFASLQNLSKFLTV